MLCNIDQLYYIILRVAVCYGGRPDTYLLSSAQLVKVAIMGIISIIKRKSIVRLFICFHLLQLTADLTCEIPLTQ